MPSKVLNQEEAPPAEVADEAPVTDAAQPARAPHSPRLTIDADPWAAAGIDLQLGGETRFYRYRFNIKTELLVKLNTLRAADTDNDPKAMSALFETLREVFDACIDMPPEVKESLPPGVVHQIVQHYLTTIHTPEGIGSPLPRSS